MHLLPTTTSSKLGSSRYSSNPRSSPPSFAGFDLERHRSFTQGSPPRWNKPANYPANVSGQREVPTWCDGPMISFAPRGDSEYDGPTASMTNNSGQNS